MRSYNHSVAETEVNLGGIVGAGAARARATSREFDPDGFLEAAHRSSKFGRRVLLSGLN
jgi:hypothetical protein